MHNPSKSPWATLAALLIFLLAGYSLFSYTLLQQIDREENRIEANIDGLRSKDATFEFLLNELTFSHQKLTEEVHKHFDDEKNDAGRLNRQGSQIAELEDKVNHLQQTLNNNENRIENAPQNRRGPASLDEAAIAYLMAEQHAAADANEPSRRKPVAFSMVEAGRAFGQHYDGGRGTDTLSIDNDSDISIDGASFISFESYKLDNGKPNLVTVLAPGLNNLENDKLEIIADAKFDKVVLDGCLKWKKTPGKTENDWLATDTENQARHVFVTVKVPVSVGKCDNYYAYQALHRSFPVLWEQQVTKKLGGKTN